MAGFKGLKSAAVVVSVLAVPALTNGCSSANSLQSTLCCSAYKPGSDMSSAQFVSNAQVNGQFEVFAQAAGDVSAVTGQAIAEITGACMNIATDLGDSPTADNGQTGTADMTFWCGEAAKLITSTLNANASASLTVTSTPPACSASFDAEASCNAKCSVNGSCNVQANPPTCTGGTLEVSCTGQCTGSATAPTIDCTGTCSGNCSGSCTAQANAAVNCVGKCDGTCSAAAQGGGTGVQADGSCNGQCSGTCTTSGSAKVQCSGTCSGQCDATCSATPGQASFECGGSCNANATPISCKGGTFKAGCNVDANCDANCQASLQAKASCTPPSVQVSFSDSGTGQLAILAQTLTTNLPAIVDVVDGKGQAFLSSIQAVVNGGATIAASGSIDLAGASCLTIVGANITQSVSDFATTLQAAASVGTTVGIK